MHADLFRQTTGAALPMAAIGVPTEVGIYINPVLTTDAPRAGDQGICSRMPSGILFPVSGMPVVLAFTANGATTASIAPLWSAF